MKKTILIFGNGYVSKFLSKTLREEGWIVYCTSRNPSPTEEAPSNPVKIVNFLDDTVKRLLSEADALLSTVPPVDRPVGRPVDGTDPVLEVYSKTMAQGNPQWVGYLSSTGVYGHHEGRWVTEETKCDPTHEPSKSRLGAEEKWLSLYKDHKVPVHIFRVSGIYGPGRNCLEEIRGGKDFTVLKKGHYFSRIHVEDINQAILASLKEPTPGEIYNLSDDEPSPLDVVHQFGATLLGHPPLKEIPFEEAFLSERARMFFQDNKKVKSHKIVQKLKIQWKYPNYRSGLLHGCLPALTSPEEK